MAAAAAVASAAASADNMADLRDGGLTGTNLLHRAKRVLNPHAPFLPRDDRIGAGLKRTQPLKIAIRNGIDRRVWRETRRDMY